MFEYMSRLQKQVWKMPALCLGPMFHIPVKKNVGFEKSQIWEQLSDFKSLLSATLMFVYINGKMDLEKLNAVNLSPTP